MAPVISPGMCDNISTCCLMLEGFFSMQRAMKEQIVIQLFFSMDSATYPLT